MQSQSASPWGKMKNSAWITGTLTLREIQARVKGSVGGLAWLFAMPVLMMTMYTTVFHGIFKARIGNTADPSQYAYSLACGMLFFGFFSEVISKAPTVISSNPNFVKKVIFPLPLLAVVNVSTSLLTAGVYWLILLALGIWQQSASVGGMLWLIVITACTLPLAVGLSFFLSAVGVYIKDVQQIIGPVLSILLFASPIFYTSQAIPPQLAKLMVLNPVTVPIEAARAALIGQSTPDLAALGLYVLAGLAVLAAGHAAFKRLRPGFSDVL